MENRAVMDHDRQITKRLVPAPDTRDPNLKAIGCLVGVPIAILSFIGVIYLAISLHLAAGEFTSFLILLGIAASIAVGRATSNWLAEQWRNLALRSIELPVVSILPANVCAGDSFTVIYHQDIRKPIQLQELVLQLVRVTRFKRQVMDLQDDSQTDEKIYQVARRKGRPLKPGEIFHREALFTIPMDAPPTGNTKEGSEQWLIHVHVYIKGQVGFERDYVLPVEKTA